MYPSVIATLAKTSFHYLQSHHNNPLGCEFAKEVITVIKLGKIIEKSREVGEYLLKDWSIYKKIPDN